MHGSAAGLLSCPPSALGESILFPGQTVEAGAWGRGLFLPPCPPGIPVLNARWFLGNSASGARELPLAVKPDLASMK